MKFSTDLGPLWQGVSQQTGPQAAPGFLAKCNNFVPDPIRGVHRRQGQQRLSAAKANIALGQVRRTVRAISTEGTLLLPGTGEPVVVKDDGTFLETIYHEDDTVVAALLANGTSAAARAGNWLVIAPNGLAPLHSDLPKYGGAAEQFQQCAYLWVRAGAYDTKYTATVRNDVGGDVTVSYHTPKATYQELLVIDDIPPFTKVYPEESTVKQETMFESAPGVHWLAYRGFTKGQPPTVEVPNGSTRNTYVLSSTPQHAHGFYWLASEPNVIHFNPGAQIQGCTVRYDTWAVEANPGYQRLVNERTAEYNEAALDYAAQAVAHSTVEYIADQLFAALQANAVPVVRVSDSVIAINGSPLSEIPKAVSSDDSELLVACSFTTDSVDNLPPAGVHGSVVAVQPADSVTKFWVRAATDDGSATGKVSWRESGLRKRGIQWNLVFGRTGYGKLFLASDETYWNAIQSYWEFPDMTQPVAGDSTTVSPPPFLGKQITALGSFQNRLIVCAENGAVAASASGDYLAFYPSSITAAIENDTVTLGAAESTRDTITQLVAFDRHLLLVGARQYMLRGDVRLGTTPLTVVAEYPGLGGTQLAKVGLATYALSTAGTHHVVQLQAGQYAESTEVFNVSPQLLGALAGADQLLPCRDINGVAVRVADKLWLMKVLDVAGGRKQAAWFSFTYRGAYGLLIGIVALDGGLGLVFKDSDGVWLDVQPFSFGSPTEPDDDSTTAEIATQPFVARNQSGVVSYGDTTIQYAQIAAEFITVGVLGHRNTRVYDAFTVVSPLDEVSLTHKEIRHYIGAPATASSVTVRSWGNYQCVVHSVGLTGQRFARGARL